MGRRARKVKALQPHGVVEGDPVVPPAVGKHDLAAHTIPELMTEIARRSLGCIMVCCVVEEDETRTHNRDKYPIAIGGTVPMLAALRKAIDGAMEDTDDPAETTA